MKTSIRTIILAAASIFAAMSCQKETAVPGTQDRVTTDETIQVNLSACLGDLASADGTKATATPVVRLIWDGTEKVQAYCGAEKIGTDLTVTPSENKMFAKLSGSITTTGLTSGTSVITFVCSNGCTADGLTFDFSSQNAIIPFVAYGTLVYEGIESFTNKMVEFKFATSVMKIAATNLGGGSSISNATIKGINTKVTLTPDATSEICGIAGSEKSNITKTAGIDTSSDGTSAIVTVGLVPDSNKGRNITLTQTGYTNKGVITSVTITSSRSYTTPASLFPCGKLNGHDYVLIEGIKWAKDNLNFLGEKLYGYSYYEIIQWAAFRDPSTEPIWVPKDIKPYYDGASDSYTKYNNSDKLVTLAPSDDVAAILWGNKWRMPRSVEFEALLKATYWKKGDGGYYVYAPQAGDAGKCDEPLIPTDKINGTYDKSDALLFFPGNQSHYYWSSTLYDSKRAYCLSFALKPVKVSNEWRYEHCYVRAVSD